MSYPATLEKLPAAQKISLVSIVNGVEPPEVTAKKLEMADLIEKSENKYIIRAGIERESIKESAEQLLDSACQELWIGIEKKIDLSQLAKDLKKIKAKFRGSNEISSTLEYAIKEAEDGNGAKTLKYLGKVGQWVLSTATKIGTDVAVNAIKHTSGLS